MLKALYIIIGIIVATFFEGFLFGAFGIRIFLLLILLLVGRLNIKIIAVILIIYSLISDVIFNYALGTDILIVSIPLILLFSSSFLFNINEGIVGYGIKFVAIALNLLLIHLLPPLLLNGSFGILTWDIVLTVIIKALVLTVCLYLLDLLLNSTRGRENNIKISKKWN